ncbi:hypothetical protein A2U01_0058234 [Trifolium medium]|uniref:Uncharacterized protein n=1 Tax=Trifolium medium TaxID=97028 RepID=A0A392RMJ4_9FABA|nr:hypothetical protein [Trifolium medium]
MNVVALYANFAVMILTAFMLNNLVAKIGYSVIALLASLVYFSSMFEAGRNFYRKVNAIGAPKPLIDLTPV